MKKDTEQKILQFIRGYHAEHQWSPTVREIGEAVGLRSPATVQVYLEELQAQEKIVYQGIRQIRVIE
jgi:repressor LexA